MSRFAAYLAQAAFAANVATTLLYGALGALAVDWSFVHWPAPIGGKARAAYRVLALLVTYAIFIIAVCDPSF